VCDDFKMRFCIFDLFSLVNLSLGGPGPYAGDSDAVATQRVAAAGGENYDFLRNLQQV